MEERRRLAYLEAMGFQPLVPRRRLPGARPSPRCDVAPLPQPMAAEPAAPAAVAPAGVAMPELESTPCAPRAKAPPPQRAARPAAARFTLTVGLVPGRILLLDEGDSAGADYQQLMINFTRALTGGAEAALQREVFRWPVVDNPALDQSRDAARQALHALIAARAEKQQLRALLLMGEVAAGLLLPEASATGAVLREDTLPLPVLITDSARNMLREPGRKRRVWQDVQPLLELLAQ